MDKVKVTSKVPTSVNLNIDTSLLEFCNADYLCIKEPNGKISIPENYNSVINVNSKLECAVRALIQKSNMKELDIDKECYWYLTIKKGFINPQTFQTKNEWHIDGFMRDDYNFSWSDSLPTIIALGDFEVTPDRYNSLSEYESQLNEVVESKVNTLYNLDRECVHKPMQNLTDETIVRTFFKITITKRLFNSKGNAWNYLIPHIKATGIRTNFV